jgi:hypothetical protein
MQPGRHVHMQKRSSICDSHAAPVYRSCFWGLLRGSSRAQGFVAALATRMRPRMESPPAEPWLCLIAPGPEGAFAGRADPKPRSELAQHHSFGAFVERKAARTRKERKIFLCSESQADAEHVVAKRDDLSHG